MLLQIYNQVQRESLMTAPASYNWVRFKTEFGFAPIESELGHGDRSQPKGDDDALSKQTPKA